MKYNPRVYKLASEYLVDHVYGSHRHSSYCCDVIGYVTEDIKLSKKEYVKLFAYYFKDENSAQFRHFGWFDGSPRNLAKLERQIALDLMVEIVTDLNNKSLKKSKNKLK